MNILLLNAKILTMDQPTPELLEGAVGIQDNKIALVSDDQNRIALYAEQHPEARVIDCRGKLLMPGLINCHTHVAMTLQRGTGDDIELMKWLNDYVWPFEAAQSDDDIEAGARLGVAEMLLGGTTTFADMYWSEHAIAKAVESLGIRAHLGESCLPARLAQFEENLPKLVAATKGCDRITACVAPHAPYTCPPELLKRCREVAEEYKLPLHIHLAETLDEERDIEARYGVSPTKYLLQNDILKPTTLLAHSIHLSDEDRDIIKSNGCSVVHNPQCNMKIASGVAPVIDMLQRGVNATMGTDGTCSNNDLDMWDEMRTASFLQKITTMDATALPPYDILKMATVNGAAALGRAGELGIIREGALADILMIDIWKPHYRPHFNIVSSLIYCGKAADVDMTIVNGEILVEDGKLVDVDLDSLCRDVEERTKSIFDRM